MRWVWAETSGKDGLPERVAAKGRADPLHCPRIDSELFGNDAHTGPPRSRQGLADSFFQYRGNRGRPRRLPSPLTGQTPGRDRFRLLASPNVRLARTD